MEAISTAEPFRFSSHRPPVTDGAAPGPAMGAGPLHAQASAEGMIDQTRREIASIVRDTAALARRDQPPSAFFAALVDRVLRAMAAEGVVVWRVDSGGGQRTFVPIARVGRITDRSLHPEQIACHARMLCEVADTGQPTIVPATPDARDAVLPANPTEVPVAVVPVMETERCDYLVEAFLEPAGGLATQRGYLRFTAQMADLAGEFLRLHRIRQATAAQQRWQRLTMVLPTLHRSLDEQSTMSAVVDGAAEALPADRVSLCRVQGGRATVIAVSHIDRVDRGSPAAQHVARLALQSDPHRACFASAADASATGADSGGADSGGAGAAESAAAAPAGQLAFEDAPVDDAPLRCEAILPLDPDGQYRLVVQTVEPIDVDPGRRDDMLALAAHAGLALRNAQTFSSVPWGRAAAALAPASLGLHRTGRGRWIAAAAFAVVLIVGGLAPVPLVVRAKGEMRPLESSYIYAPRAGTVTEVLVEHGAAVRRGDLLVRMVDRGLEQDYDALLGRRAVLVQRAAELGSALVDHSQRGQRSDSQQLLADQRVIEQERLAVDQQLELLRKERQTLELHSDRDGVVDGWQLRRQWNGRPVGRGQMLLSVIDPAGPWEVEALIPQSRLDHVLEASKPPATVVLQAQPDAPLTAQLQHVGPAVVSASGDGSAGRALLRITSPSMPAVQTGAPADVAIDCGTRPLAYVAFQDLIRTVRGRWSMYF